MDVVPARPECGPRSQYCRWIAQSCRSTDPIWRFGSLLCPDKTRNDLWNDDLILFFTVMIAMR